MPSVQDEHSSEHSQAFQGLLISDSPDDKADESPERLLCVILDVGLRAPVTLVVCILVYLYINYYEGLMED